MELKDELENTFWTTRAELSFFKSSHHLVLKVLPTEGKTAEASSTMIAKIFCFITKIQSFQRRISSARGEAKTPWRINNKRNARKAYAFSTEACLRRTLIAPFTLQEEGARVVEADVALKKF